MRYSIPLIMWIGALARAAPDTTPRFEDFLVDVWHGMPAPIQITTRAERRFKTRLTNAAKQEPNFGGHYRFTVWGCGSECISGAIIDLQTGRIFSPPLARPGGSWMHFSVCQSAYENSGVDVRVSSRLLVLRCGLNYSEREQANVPEAYYFVWEGNRFKQIFHAPGARKH